MAADFDPYHKWLGISPDERLPTHYRLLGLIAFESDREVIEAAADRVMTYLQDVSSGAEMANAQKLLSEVSRARLCLLNAEQKAAYDEKLREKLAALEADEKLRSGLPSQQPDEKLRSGLPSQQPDEKLRSGLPSQQPDAMLPGELPSESADTKLGGGPPPLEANLERHQEVPLQEPDLPRRRPLVLVCVGILILLFGGGLLGWLLSGQSGDPEIPTADQQRAFANRTDRSAPAILPPSRGTKHATGTAKKTNLKKNKQPQATTTNSNNTKESESSTRDAVEKAPPMEKKKPQDKGSSAGSNGPSSFQIYPLTVDPNDNKSSLLTYPKQADGFHRVDAGTSTAKYYRLTATAPVDGITGFWIQFKSNAAAGDVLQQQAVLNNLEVKLAGNTIDWMAAQSSAAEQQQGVERAIDPKPGSGWMINLDSNKDVWAVFATKKSFHGETPLDVEIVFQHKDKMLRIPQFRISVITGNGTVEEMTQAVRDHIRVAAPFEKLTPQPLPSLPLAGSPPSNFTMPIGLGSVFLRGEDRLQVSLLGGEQSGAEGEFLLRDRAHPEAATERSWELCFLPSAGGSETPIAQLRRQEDRLSLAWLPAAAEIPAAGYLSNCVLELTLGEFIERISLREVTLRPPIDFSPARPVNKGYMIDVFRPPDPALLHLVLQFPTSILSEFNPSRELDLSENTTQALIGSDDGIQVNLEMGWKENYILLTAHTKWQPEGEGEEQPWKFLRVKNLRKEIEGLRRPLKEQKEVLRILQRAQDLSKRKRLNYEQKVEWNEIRKKCLKLGFPVVIKRSQLDKAVQQEEQVVEALSVEIRRRENVMRLIERLEGGGGINYRVYVLVDGGPLDLVRSTAWLDD